MEKFPTNTSPVNESSIATAKVQEYADRFFTNGESVESHQLPPSFEKAVREEIQRRREFMKDTVPVPESTNEQTLEQLYALIPSRYRKLPAELIEDFWQEPIRVDDVTGGKEFKERKARIVEQIRKAETQSPLSTLETPRPIEPSLEVTLTKSLSLDKNIQRVSGQEVFGDSNGSYTGFVEHLQSRGLAQMQDDGNLVWTGGNTRTTFLGDILGDRTPEGEKIYSQLVHLRTLAQNEGGDISWLAGNHDNMFNAVLFGFSTEKGTSVEKDMGNRLTSYIGNLEPARYLPENILQNYFNQENIRATVEGILSGSSEIQKTIERRKKVLETIQKNPNTDTAQLESYKASIAEQENAVQEFQNVFTNSALSLQEKVIALTRLGDGLPKNSLVTLGNEILRNRTSILETVRKENPALLEGIYSQRLATVEDDVLYCHTNLTHNMIRVIEAITPAGGSFKDGIGKLNTFYQSMLRWYGSPEPRNPHALTDAQITYFNTIRNEFISTDSTSRINYTEDPTLSDTQKKEITTRLRTHGINAVLHGHTDENGEAKGDASLPILSIDRSAYKGSEGVSNRPTAVASISTSGTLSYY